jgi:hypothetical protein
VIAGAIKKAGYNAPRTEAIKTFDTNPDTIIIMYDSGELDNVRIVVEMPPPSSELRCDGQDLSAVSAEDWIYLYDPFADVGQFLQVTHVQNSDHLQHNTMPTTRLYPAGTYVVKMIQLKFYVDQSDPHHPRLMIKTFTGTPQPFADNIIGLNFRYFLANGAIVDQISSSEMIRMVEIDVVGRTDVPDPDFVEAYRTRNFNLGKGETWISIFNHN